MDIEAQWDSELSNFIKTIKQIAFNVGKKLRLEQLVSMALILYSKHHTTLIQLATGFGKSLMLSIIAKYLHQTTGKKVLVLVPSEVLKLD